MDWLKEKKLDTGGVTVVDGSGLSMQNRVTTDFLCRYLAAISRETFFKDFLNTLPKAGEGSSTKKLQSELPTGVNVSLKSGTISGVKAYAGYVDAANGDRLAFAVICNGFDGSSSAVTEKMMKIILKIANIY